MLDKYYGFFEVLKGARKALELWNYPEWFIEEFPRFVADFLLIGVMLVFIKFIATILGVIRYGRKEYKEKVQEKYRKKYEIIPLLSEKKEMTALSGILYAAFCLFAIFFAMLAVNMLRITFSNDEIRGYISNAKANGITAVFPDSWPLPVIVILCIIILIPILIYLAIAILLISPTIISLVGNVRAYKLWGFAQTYLDLFFGLAIVLLILIIGAIGVAVSSFYYLYAAICGVMAFFNMFDIIIIFI